ncbi:tocopherol O-methyltransferase [Exophiala viscosa]|uniref:Tocopherol O-methyltransferase n=1 Tax=Exophiala viscosa TaxID=2486360 RepID=A0AAN6DR81_9EURO|nr:tocopherol O-methyltransferase [Exophiala viscosa]KAI1624785.1 tocopherol O-methyltransferase [Exophiala viscosa]
MGDPSEAPAQTHIGDQYDVPEFEPHSSVATLKERIRHHYELASDYYYSLWGQHIHHAYFLSPSDTKETGQTNLINLLLEISALKPATTVLDVGCGIGGTTRHLARDHGCTVTGITISGRQVQIAKRLTGDESSTPVDADGFTPIGTNGGRVRYQELDAEKMDAHFSADSFDAVWISEALSHFPDKPLFFRNAAKVLKVNGKLVIADWFKDDDLNQEAMENDIEPIEDGMLLPPLSTQSDYISLAEKAGLKVLHPPKDISKEVAKTWDISWSLVSSPSLWAFAISQGRDGLAFLQSFRAMRRGYANGNFRYAVMAFEKPASGTGVAPAA